MKIKNVMLLGFILIFLIAIPVSFASDDLSSDGTGLVSDYNYNYNSLNSTESTLDSSNNFKDSNSNSLNTKFIDEISTSSYGELATESDVLNQNNYDIGFISSSISNSSLMSGISLGASSFISNSSLMSGISLGASSFISNSSAMPNINLNTTFTALDGLTLTDIDTVYVNASYTGSSQNGAQATPFKTINAAMTNLLSTSSKNNLFIAEGTYTVSNTMTLSRSINIIGESTLNSILSGNNAYNIFYLNNPYIKVNIVNLTLTNGNSYYGGAIYNNQTTLNLVNLIFKNNVAKYQSSYYYKYDGSGGAIYNSYGTINIFNSKFLNNSATGPYDSWGGAISNKLGNITIINSQLLDNSVSGNHGEGGAIASSYANLAIFNTTIANNTVKSNYSVGGAIHNYLGFNVYILNSTINNNVLLGKETYGSAILSQGVLLEIINSTISNNLANGSCIENGTVYSLNGLFYFENSTMKNNTIVDPKSNILMCLEDQMIVNNAFNSSSINASSLPSSYDLRNLSLITSVKDQGNSGSCWAFAALAALESYLLKTENITYDFSENNMKNLMGIYGVNGTDYDPNNDGGNYYMALAYLLRWSGTINETQDRFNDYSSSSKYNLDVSKHVQDVLYIPIRTGYLDNNQIKEAILKYGALYTSISASSLRFMTSESYYTNTFSFANHAVAIVGWDDNYSASNFAISPPGDGAFIIKNSWGTKYGDKGYWYVSYYDNGIAGFGVDSISAFAYTNVENASNYKDNYQYDILGNTYQSLGYNCETAWFANQFSSTNNNPLSAIGFYTYGDSTYLADIYVNNQLKYSQNGSISGAGYHTIKLTDYVNLAIGDIFKVAVKLTSPNCLFPVAIESKLSDFSSKATSSLNQSFISFDGVEWYDIAQKTTVPGFNNFGINNYILNSTNVCLKAYTSYATDLRLNATNNASFYYNGDLVEITLNLTNYGDTATNFNISSILDSGLVVKSFNATKGSYDSVNNVWSFDTLNNGESGILKLVILLNTNKNEVASTFVLNNKTYNANNKTSVTVKNYYSGFTQILGSNMDTLVKSNDKINFTLLDALNNPLYNKTIQLVLADLKTSNKTVYNISTDDNGIVNLAIDLTKGNYTIFVEFAGDNDYNASNLTVNISVNQLPAPLIIANNYTAVYGQDGNFTAKLVDANVNPLSGYECVFILKNQLNQTKIYWATTNDEGVAKLAINLIPGTWYIDVSYPGDDIFPESNNSTGTLIINSEPKSIMSADNYTAKYGQAGNFTTKLLDENNNPMIGLECMLILKNQLNQTKIYWATTNIEGVAKLAINLIPGTWYITAWYPGDEYPESNNSTGTLVIS